MRKKLIINRKNIICLLLLTLCLSLEYSACSAEPEITVNPKNILGNVSRLILGQNIVGGNGKYIFGKKNSSGPVSGGGVWNPKKRKCDSNVLRMSKDIGIGVVRYPGGCITHNFNWKDAVGPIKKRTYFTFGLDEYLKYCRNINAEPLITISAYVGGAKEAGELVEYLNAPARPEYPWAMKRAEWGHQEPYKVKYFEMGNESDHGNHHVQPFKIHTPFSYVKWFNDCAKAMRGIDPSIKLGAHVGTGKDSRCPWNQVVLSGTSGNADFIAIHVYEGGVRRPQKNDLNVNKTDLFMRECMAAGDQAEAKLREYRKLIKLYAGKELPVGISEYNMGFIQEKPFPYRFSFGAALFCADFVRIAMKPENNVFMANYWHLLNGYWGFLREDKYKKGSWNKLPAYYLYKMWNEHSGTKLVDVKVNNEPKLSFEGSVRLRRTYSAAKKPGEKKSISFRIHKAKRKKFKFIPNQNSGGTLVINKFQGAEYPEIAKFKVNGGKTYKLSFDARRSSVDEIKSILGLGMCDSRGWGLTNSATRSEGMQNHRSWKSFSCEMSTLPDAEKLNLLIRIISTHNPVSAKIEIRNIKIEEMPDCFKDYSSLTSSASLSSDGKTLYLIVFNKGNQPSTKTKIKIVDSSARRAKVWVVTGPGLECTNLNKTEVKEMVSGDPVKDVSENGFEYIFPAYSMTAFEILRK